METNFKLEKLDLIKVPGFFSVCDGCIFHGEDNTCELAKMPEQLKQKNKSESAGNSNRKIVPR